LEVSVIANLPLFDLLLALTLAGLAWTALTAKNLFKAIVLFISFGMLMAVAWLRLQAVDIALAEAAIGAGLTGAIFIMAIRRISLSQPSEDDPRNNISGKSV
jgi:uncharacterized MnhB-related membrane protein